MLYLVVVWLLPCMVASSWVSTLERDGWLSAWISRLACSACASSPRPSARPPRLVACSVTPSLARKPCSISVEWLGWSTRWPATILTNCVTEWRTPCTRSYLPHLTFHNWNYIWICQFGSPNELRLCIRTLILLSQLQWKQEHLPLTSPELDPPSWPSRVGYDHIFSTLKTFYRW